MLESERGKALMKYGAEIESPSEEEEKIDTDDMERAEQDEVAFILDQRMSSKGSGSKNKSGSSKL